MRQSKFNRKNSMRLKIKKTRRPRTKTMGMFPKKDKIFLAVAPYKAEVNAIPESTA